LKTFLAFCWLNTFLCFGITNSINITEMAGVFSSNFPVQIGRPFLQGEIANYPPVLVNGTTATTQGGCEAAIRRWRQTRDPLVLDSYAASKVYRYRDFPKPVVGHQCAADNSADARPHLQFRRADGTGCSELRSLSAENSVGPSRADCKSLHLLDFRAGGNDRLIADQWQFDDGITFVAGVGTL
jgi:hypothetical protein